jgi:hypothetical protein
MRRSRWSLLVLSQRLFAEIFLQQDAEELNQPATILLRQTEGLRRDLDVDLGTAWNVHP